MKHKYRHHPERWGTDGTGCMISIILGAALWAAVFKFIFHWI